MNWLDGYLQKLKNRNRPELAVSIRKTIDDVAPSFVSKFSFREHTVGLLVGDVQSGKTSHVFGLMCAAADQGFGLFLLLTTDNILLQQQTFHRACADLTNFCVCDENDFLKFRDNNMRRPVVVVLKKNGRVLRQWKNNLSSTHFCAGNPLFIVDDEADAASLNTQVNRGKVSTINKCLVEIKHTTSSSVYLQVTGTPQAVLLQSVQSGWKPLFVHYFSPGSTYIGGNFFFAKWEGNPHVIPTDDIEGNEILGDDESLEGGLETALITHLVTSAQIFLTGGNVCNFLIHPSFKISEHEKFAAMVRGRLKKMCRSYETVATRSRFQRVYQSLKTTKPSMVEFDLITEFVRQCFQHDGIRVLVLNSKASYEENSRYDEGVNVVIGGNSLGRGVTFPQLQTIYYCRTAKRPQADTMWQHTRMFGYDRDLELMRVFMPPRLCKLFSDINATNNSIAAQIQHAENGPDIRIAYPTTLRPTRKNVLDQKRVHVLSGGVNYFPFSPTNNDIEELNRLLDPFREELCTVSLRFFIKVLRLIGSDGEDWDSETFIGFLNSFLAENPLAQGRLIVRRGRDVARGTGTLLSPNDRAIGDSIRDFCVLTLYKVTGTKGWNGEQLWIPNIKLPGNNAYYCGDRVQTE